MTGLLVPQAPGAPLAEALVRLAISAGTLELSLVAQRAGYAILHGHAGGEVRAAISS